MSDQADPQGPVEPSTNGTRTVARSEATNGTHRATPLNRQSVDGRLEAMRETIRTWDWRAALVEVGPPPLEIEKSEAAPPPSAPTKPVEADSDSESLSGDVPSLEGVAGAPPRDMWAAPAPVATAALQTEAVALPDEVAAPSSGQGAVAPPLMEATPPPTPQVTDAARTETSAPLAAKGAPPTETLAPLAPPATDGPATEEVAIPTELPASSSRADSADQRTGGGPDGIGTSWFGQEPETAPEPHGPLRRLWTHPWAKLTIAVVAAVVVVTLIVGGIRYFAKSPTSAGTTATTVTQPSSRPVHHSHFAAPISAAQLAAYEGFASSFQNANIAATRGLTHAGSTPTASQVVLVVVAYRTAVNLYNFQLHFVQWPESMQNAIAADHAQLQALTSFLQAFSSVAPNGVPGWLSLLNDRANSTQVADNVLRQDLGLPASSAFP